MGKKGPAAKPMAALFKMAYQDKGGVSALMKALVGDQHKLPENLKKAIKAAPEDSPAKSYGSKKKSPVMKKGRYEVNKEEGTYRDRTGEGGIGVNKKYKMGTGPMAKGKK